MDDNDSITGVDANLVYVSGMCKNSEQHNDQCGGLPTSIHQPLGFNKGMLIASLNVNGLRTHFDEEALLIQNLGIHILALCETKLCPSFPRELTASNGYEQERLDQTCRGGGVSIYIQNSLNYKRRIDLPLPSGDLEFICIEVFPSRNKPFLLLACYRPPSDPVETFISLIKFSLFWILKIKKSSSLVILTVILPKKPGEQNVDDNTKHLCNLYGLHNFHQHIMNPTTRFLFPLLL